MIRYHCKSARNVKEGDWRTSIAMQEGGVPLKAELAADWPDLIHPEFLAGALLEPCWLCWTLTTIPNATVSYGQPTFLAEG